MRISIFKQMNWGSEKLNDYAVITPKYWDPVSASKSAWEFCTQRAPELKGIPWAHGPSVALDWPVLGRGPSHVPPRPLGFIKCAKVRYLTETNSDHCCTPTLSNHVLLHLLLVERLVEIWGKQLLYIWFEFSGTHVHGLTSLLCRVNLLSSVSGWQSRISLNHPVCRLTWPQTTKGHRWGHGHVCPAVPATRRTWPWWRTRFEIDQVRS